MRRWHLLLGLLCSCNAHAAEITTVPLGPEQALVTITGQLTLTDISAFDAKATGVSNGLIALSSDGGSLMAGVEIGTHIRLKGYKTVVPDGVRCASACALAWLGGVQRFMGPTAQIGFHAAYMVEQGHAHETGVGNALAGAYLARIGLPDRAIVYITQAPPSSMTWLNLTDAKQLGIEVSPWIIQSKVAHNTRTLPTEPTPLHSAPQATLEPHSPTDQDVKLARRVGFNFRKRYKEAGISGINESILLCYARAKELRRLDSVKYCFLLDVVANQMDDAMTKILHAPPTPFDTPKSVVTRVGDTLTAIGVDAKAQSSLLLSWFKLTKLVMSAVIEAQKQMP